MKRSMRRSVTSAGEYKVREFLRIIQKMFHRLFHLRRHGILENTHGINVTHAQGSCRHILHDLTHGTLITEMIHGGTCLHHGFRTMTRISAVMEHHREFRCLYFTDDVFHIERGEIHALFVTHQSGSWFCHHYAISSRFTQGQTVFQDKFRAFRQQFVGSIGILTDKNHDVTHVIETSCQ